MKLALIVCSLCRSCAGNGAVSIGAGSVAGFFAALLMDFLLRVILNEVKNPEPRPRAIIVLDSSLPLRMTGVAVKTVFA